MDDSTLTIKKLVTPTTFFSHKGFDLTSFTDESSPPSGPITFKAPSNQTYADFKRRISQRFDISVSRFQLWGFVDRRNKTVRPDECIDSLPQSKSLIQTKPWRTFGDALRSITMDFFVFFFDPTTDLAAAKRADKDTVMIFFKYFNPTEKQVRGVGYTYVPLARKIIDFIPRIRKQMCWAPQTPLTLYEEIKPGMIDFMKPKLSFAQSEIANGDIICFEIAPSEPEIMDFERRGLRATAIDFYKDLYKAVQNSPPKPIPTGTIPQRPQQEGARDLVSRFPVPASQFSVLQVLM
ncbi:ubiquitin-specific protease ubp15 [Paramarasmius palmivorus]|uniref:Ubiquitin-specific protease ubp15 n=1 Tax=Paramarasmius palmivorus TaxID=297713 RepID=A0AAW0CXV0_9AGAR